jgi:hypothetical protein
MQRAAHVSLQCVIHHLVLLHTALAAELLGDNLGGVVVSIGCEFADRTWASGKAALIIVSMSLALIGIADSPPARTRAPDGSNVGAGRATVNPALRRPLARSPAAPVHDSREPGLMHFLKPGKREGGAGEDQESPATIPMRRAGMPAFEAASHSAASWPERTVTR